MTALINFDIFIFQLISGFSHRWWLFDWLGIFLASYLAYLLVIGIILFGLKRENWRDKIYFFSWAILAAILSRGILTEIIRFFFPRSRPFVSLNIESLINYGTTPSFPSGHAAAFFALALVIFYFSKKWGWRFFIAAALMGLARIFIGVHWPTDILLGAVVGLLSAFLIKKLLPKINS